MRKLPILITLLLISFTTLSAQNLISNGNFSTWTDENPDDWILSGSSINVEQTTSFYYDAESCAKLSWSTTSTRYLYQIIDIDPSTQYYCETWFYDNDSGGRGRIYFTWLDSEDSSISSQGSSDYTVDDDQWVKKTYSAISPDNAHKLRIELRCYDVSGWDGNAELYVDASWVNIGDDFLPVTLSSFTAAVYLNQYVSVNWVTQSESSLSHFNIYRNELLINSQNAHNQTNETNYLFIDEEIAEGETYQYLLEIVELDGSSSSHGPYSITVLFAPDNEDPSPEPIGESNLQSNYPNPFNPDTTINFTIRDGEEGTLKIFNVKGQTIMEEKFPYGEHSFKWEATDVDSGVYFYTLETLSIIQSKKMILIK